MVSIYQWLPNSSQSIGFSSNVELEKGLGLAISLQLNSCSEAGKKGRERPKRASLPWGIFCMETRNRGECKPSTKDPAAGPFAISM